MKRAQTQEERYEEMMHAPVDRLITKLAIPTILSMLVTSIYNMADTFFVSQISTSASGAVGIIFSLMAIVQAGAYMIGIGSGNNIARLLGQQKVEQAKRYAAVGFFTELIVGTLLATVGLLNLEDLVYALGSTETIAPYAMEYAKYILMATPFIMCAFGINNMLRFQGNAVYAMVGIMTGGVLNMILDPLFIFVFDMGIAGAAIATALSQFISFVILTLQCNRNEACISIQLKYFRPTISMYKSIVHCGLPSLARQSIASVSVILLNFAAHPYGDAAIAAMSIVNRFTVFLNSAILGFGQGFQPVCGFNFGAKKYRRVMDSYNFCLRFSFLALCAIAVVTFVFAEPIVSSFRKEDAEVIRIGTFALRAQSLTLPLTAQLTMSNMFTQTIGYGFRATLIAVLRQGLFLIPFLLILPQVIGLPGIQIAQPLSDLISAIVAFLITRRILQELKAKSREEDGQ